jgi:hypothetical protein
MTRWLLLLLAVGLWHLGWCDEPAASQAPGACVVLNNRILGPRVPERSLPLLSGDPVQGFHAACSVSWSQLSPKNRPLAITDCYRGSLLQIANQSACPSQPGPLWINARWVITSGELQDMHAHAALCQQLETGAWAGTRDLQLDCLPRKKELNLEPGANVAAKPSPAAEPPAAPATPPTEH